MTRLFVSDEAQEDIQRLCDFLSDSLPHEAARTGAIIADGLVILRDHPLVGRPVAGGLKELVISRGKSGYLALYDYDAAADVVAVLAVRHQRECDYDAR